MNAFYLLDFFMSEYGWGWEEAKKFVFQTPIDVVVKLYQQIINRQREYIKLKTKLTGYAVSAGFSGKIDLLDRIFGENNQAVDNETNKQKYLAGVRSLWIKMGRDPKVLEEMIKNGKEIKF